jgi:predicted HicB family RNase H-like nuclease
MTTAEQKPKERTTVYLPPSLKQTIAHEAEEAGQTLSIWVERALASHIKAKVTAQ